VAIGYTPYQLVYGLHPLMLIEYVLLVISGDHRDAEPTGVLIAIITKLEKLQDNILEAKNNLGANQWSKFMWNQQKTQKKVPIWKLCFVVSQRRKYTFGKIQEKMVWSIQGTILLTE